MPQQPVSLRSPHIERGAMFDFPLRLAAPSPPASQIRPSATPIYRNHKPKFAMQIGLEWRWNHYAHESYSRLAHLVPRWCWRQTGAFP